MKRNNTNSSKRNAKRGVQNSYIANKAIKSHEILSMGLVSVSSDVPKGLSMKGVRNQGVVHCKRL